MAMVETAATSTAWMAAMLDLYEHDLNSFASNPKLYILLLLTPY